MTAAAYERALRRMVRLTFGVGAAGVILSLILYGPRIAAGFLLGATFSLLNLRWWTGVAEAIGGSGKAPIRGSAGLLAMRYVFVAGAIYVIVKFLKITPAALLVGLLVSVAAVMLEALYEVISSRN
jgi:ATP synthase I subunit